MSRTLSYYKRRNFYRQTVSQFLVVSAKIYMSAKTSVYVYLVAFIQYALPGIIIINWCTWAHLLWLHVAGIQKVLCRYLLKNSNAIWWKQKSCWFYHGTMSSLYKSILSLISFSILKSGHQQKIVPAKSLEFGHL